VESNHQCIRGFSFVLKKYAEESVVFFFILGRKYTITALYSLFNTLLEASRLFFYKCLFHRSFVFLTAQMSVFMVFCGPHLPLAFQFVCGPKERAANGIRYEL